MSSNNLLPLFKWTGGKRKEIKHFSPFYPDFVKNNSKYTFVEPFVGAGAVFWDLNNTIGKNVINDFDSDLVNFYRMIASQDAETLALIKEVSDLFADKTVDNHSEREAAYYRYRNMDRNGGLDDLSASQRAARFYIVNQLAFSGMRRFNGNGEFNVPFGHYKNFNSSSLVNEPHVELLKKTEIRNGDYRPVIEDNDNENTFIFLDPPYTRVMKKYSVDGDFGDDKQRELAQVIRGLKKAKVMLVIDKSDLTMELYSDLVVHTYGLNYGVNIRNRFSTDVEHIVVTNY